MLILPKRCPECLEFNKLAGERSAGPGAPLNLRRWARGK
jgi:hypothetical protein